MSRDSDRVPDYVYEWRMILRFFEKQPRSFHHDKFSSDFRSFNNEVLKALGRPDISDSAFGRKHPIDSLYPLVVEELIKVDDDVISLTDRGVQLANATGKQLVEYVLDSEANELRYISAASQVHAAADIVDVDAVEINGEGAEIEREPQPRRGVADKRFQIFYATNRESLGEIQGCPYFSRGKSANLASWGAVPVIVKNQECELVGVNGGNHADVLNQLQLEPRLAAARPRILIYVHGWATDFVKGARELAYLSRALQFDGVPLLFSWPSGDLFTYFRAISSQDAAAEALADTIKVLLTLPMQPEISVISHSMGVEVLTQALSNHFKSPPIRRLDELLLVAGDTSRTDFERRVGKFRHFCRRISLYASSWDLALRFSSIGVYQRIGDSTPDIFCDSSVESIDASIERMSSRWRHSYHLTGSRATIDMSNVIQNVPAPRGLTVVKEPRGTHYKVQ